MDKVAKKLGVEVGEEEINGHIARLAIERGQRPERLREEMARDGSLAHFGLQVRDEKCIAQLLESAKITEAAPEKDAKITKKTPKKKTKKAAKKSSKKDAGAKKVSKKRKTAKQKNSQNP